MLKKLIAAGATLAVALGIVAIVAMPAEAHNGQLSGSAVCTDGNYVITWNADVINTPSDNKSNATLTFIGAGTASAANVSYVSGTAGQATPAPTVKPGVWVSGGYVVNTLDGSNNTNARIGNYSDVFTQTLPGTTTGSVTLHGVYQWPAWDGGQNHTADSAPVKLTGDCAQNVTPAQVTWNDGVCTGPGQVSTPGYIVPDGKNGGSVVLYTVQVKDGANGTWATVGAGPQTATAGHTLYWQAVPASKNVKIPNPSMGSHLFTAKTGDQCNWTTTPPTLTPNSAACVAGPQVTPGSFTIGAVPTGLNVTYSTSTNTSATITGPTTVDTVISGLPAGTTVTISYTAQSGYTAPSNPTSPFTIGGPDAKHCIVSTEPTWTDNVCLPAKPGNVPDDSFTIPAVPGVIYTYENVDYTTKQTFTTKPGDHVVVTARPDTQSGYVFPEGATSATWSHDFTSVSNGCIVTVTPKVDLVDGLCTSTTPKTFTQGYYEATAVTGVTYKVSLNGGTPTEISTGDLGTKIPVDAGTTVAIVASVDPSKYVLSGTSSWTLKYVTQADDCLTPTPTVKAASTAQQCVVDGAGHGSYTGGTIDLTYVEHVVYSIDGTKVVIPAGTVPGATVSVTVSTGVKHTVTAEAETGYKLTGYPADGWSFTITPALACGDLDTHPLVVPSVSWHQAGCFSTAGYTLTNDLGEPGAIVWTVNGSTVAENSYPVNGVRTVTIHAAPADGFGFAQDTQASWTIQFTGVATSCDLKTLALTGVGNPLGWIGLAYLLVILGVGLIGVPLVLRRRSPKH